MKCRQSRPSAGRSVPTHPGQTFPAVVPLQPKAAQGWTVRTRRGGGTGGSPDAPLLGGGVCRLIIYPGLKD